MKKARKIAKEVSEILKKDFSEYVSKKRSYESFLKEVLTELERDEEQARQHLKQSKKDSLQFEPILIEAQIKFILNMKESLKESFRMNVTEDPKILNDLFN